MLRSEFWPTPSAHREYWERHNCPHVYEYDPTDDGPEADIIKSILATAALDLIREMTFEELLGDLIGRALDFGDLW
jgi:hypothetical protein